MLEKYWILGLFGPICSCPGVEDADGIPPRQIEANLQPISKELLDQRRIARGRPPNEDLQASGLDL